MTRLPEASDGRDDPCFSSATELAAGYRDGSLSPRAIVEAHLRRIAALDGTLGAYVSVHADAARTAADAAECRFHAGAPLGPLDGVPVAVKDLFAIAGTACAAGSPSLRWRVSGEDAAVIRRLRAGGAVLLGKVHTVEFALGGWGTNAYLGAPRNPWSAATPMTAGGSIRRAKTTPTSVDPRLPALLQRKPVRVVTVAAANRTARVAWAIMTRGGIYRAPAATAA